MLEALVAMPLEECSTQENQLALKVDLLAVAQTERKTVPYLLPILNKSEGGHSADAITLHCHGIPTRELATDRSTDGRFLFHACSVAVYGGNRSTPLQQKEGRHQLASLRRTLGVEVYPALVMVIFRVPVIFYFWYGIRMDMDLRHYADCRFLKSVADYCISLPRLLRWYQLAGNILNNPAKWSYTQTSERLQAACTVKRTVVGHHL